MLRSRHGSWWRGRGRGVVGARGVGGDQVGVIAAGHDRAEPSGLGTHRGWTASTVAAGI
ncbi:hypothetical protein AB0G00_36845 [Nocardia salmonicida]|uniref:hypothetical protein n=1 Tax=Nocardia salmonicida TaxID=53431 RepID=UPI0033C6C09F